MLQICSFTLQLQMLLEMLPLKGILQISIPLQLVICSFLTFCYLPPGKCANISMQIPAQSSLFLNTNYNLQMRSGFKTAISICKPKSYAALAQPPDKTSDLLSGSLHLLNISMSSSTWTKGPWFVTKEKTKVQKVIFNRVIHTVVLSWQNVCHSFLKCSELFPTNLKTNRRWQELHENYSCWWNRKYPARDRM